MKKFQYMKPKSNEGNSLKSHNDFSYKIEKQDMKILSENFQDKSLKFAPKELQNQF